jgi:hypothetical protein
VGTTYDAYSQNHWYTSSYTSTNDISYQKYSDYIKARKVVTTISIPLGASSFPTDGIYSISGNVILSDPSVFNGKNIVLVVDGTVKFIKNGVITSFIPTTGSIAVLAKTIDINPNVTEIDAILIGQTVSTGTFATGLKIKGNLIDESVDELALSIDRTQADARRPALFVVFDMSAYINVLPYLSTSTYDWRQIQ